MSELGARVKVVKNDEVDMAWIKDFDPSHIVISPGPGDPTVADDFGVCTQVLEEFEGPILGVCLGCQGMAAVNGAQIKVAPEIMHGMRSVVEVDGKFFEGLPKEIEVMRYHSLIIDEPTLSDDFVVAARTKDKGLIMAIEHKKKPMFGVQFHPESIGTPDGMKILENFLAF